MAVVVARFALCALLVPLAACDRGKARASGPPEPASSATATTSASSSSTHAVSASASTSASASAPSGPVTVEVAIGGDAIPQVKVLANQIADIMAAAPSCWSRADARVLNLEAPIGERDGLPGDKTLLAYAAPPGWFADLYAGTHVSAFVVANNHACDLGPDGLAKTMAEAEKLSAPLAGAAHDDPWKRVDVIEKGGRRVCLVAWTTFLNDKGKKAKGCVDGSSGVKLARAELGKAGISEIDKQLSAEHRWDGCDARVAYLHGGREYQGQIRPVMEQAQAAAAYVDAVIVSHPHVPDGVELVTRPKGTGTGRRADGAVPVFRSLGNFISNQGVGWTPGMSADIVETGGSPDPIRTVWTRVAMIARLSFEWSAAAPKGSAPDHVRYGYTLAFMERDTPGEGGPGKGKDPQFRAALAMRLRPLPSGPSDAIATKLAKAKPPFGALLSGKCMLAPDASPSCDSESAGTAAP